MLDQGLQQQQKSLFWHLFVYTTEGHRHNILWIWFCGGNILNKYITLCEMGELNLNENWACILFFIVPANQN